MKSGEYSELKAFLAVAEHDSFSLASKTLRISPSALSQIIKRLEDRVKLQLFNRTTRSVQLTNEGKELYGKVSPAIHDLEAALVDVFEEANTPSGVVKVHSITTASKWILSPILGEFHRLYPKITLDIYVDDTVVDITQGGFDVGFGLGEYLKNDMVAYPLGGSMELVASASPDYLSNHGIPKEPKDLLDHNCINWRYMAEKYIYRWEFYQDERWVCVNVDGTLITTSREVALSAALQSVGILLWTENELKPYIESGQLVRVLEDYCPKFDGLYMYYYRKSHTPKALITFINFLREKYPRLNK